MPNKLLIPKIERISVHMGIGYVDRCRSEDVDKLEETANELVSALIDDIKRAEKYWVDNWLDDPDSDPLTTDAEIIQQCHIANADKIALIESATEQTWEEVRAREKP